MINIQDIPAMQNDKQCNSEHTFLSVHSVRVLSL